MFGNLRQELLRYYALQQVSRARQCLKGAHFFFFTWPFIPDICHGPHGPALSDVCGGNNSGAQLPDLYVYVPAMKYQPQLEVLNMCIYVVAFVYLCFLVSLCLCDVKLSVFVCICLVSNIDRALLIRLKMSR